MAAKAVFPPGPGLFSQGCGIVSVTPRNAVGRATPADSLERLRVRALVSLQLLFARYRKGLSEASDRVTPEETLVLRDLEERGLDAEGLRVMLSGGHVVVDDPELYERWSFPKATSVCRAITVTWTRSSIPTTA
jgi:hypothetical protein